MNDGVGKPTNKYVSISLSSVYAGVIFGIAFVALYMISGWIWSLAYDHEHYNYQLDTVKNVLYYIFLFSVPVLAGIFSTTWASLRARGIASVTLSGFITGGVLSLFASAALLAGLSPPTSEGIIFLFVLFFMVLAVITAVSAFVYEAFSSFEIDDDFNVRSRDKRTNTRIMAIIMATLLISMALIPPAVAYAGVCAGLIHRQPHDGVIIVVTAERLGDGSIKIINQGGPTDYWLDEDSVLTVILNGKNVTNMDTIKKDGLSLSIAPAEGLRPQAGSSVVISGKDISLLESEGPRIHVVVFAKDKDGWSFCVLDASIEL